MVINDPVMAAVDRLPLRESSEVAASATAVVGSVSPEPFGLRLAVAPVAPRDDRHKKTYYTVTVKEATRVSRDGKVEVIQDDVQRERED